MGILVDRIGMRLPFVKIGKPVAVGVPFQNIGVGDGQVELFQPLIWNGWMNHRGLERRRHAIGVDEMFLRDKKPRALMGCPLRRLLKFFRRMTQFHCLARR